MVDELASTCAAQARLLSGTRLMSFFAWLLVFR
jgi:hypothetical protein